LAAVPWCDDCSKFWNDQNLDADRKCPTCGRVLVAPRKGVPWHFKLMLLALAVYMVYRIYWLIEWLPKHI
jgi:DNA-directed RNA polymerase subunit RPC12/RpoP